MDFSGDHVNVRIIRSLFDSRMSAILSGTGGVSGQLCTTHHTQFKDLDLIGVVSELIVLFMMQIIFSMTSILKN